MYNTSHGKNLGFALYFGENDKITGYGFDPRNVKDPSELLRYAFQKNRTISLKFGLECRSLSDDLHFKTMLSSKNLSVSEKTARVISIAPSCASEITIFEK